MTSPIVFRTSFTRFFIPELDACNIVALAVDESGETLFSGRLYVDRWRNGDDFEVARSLILVRHFLPHSEIAFFATDLRLDEETGEVVDMYVLTNNKVVLLMFNADSRVLRQYLLELIPSRSSYMVKSFNRGQAVTVAERAITLNRLLPPVTISVGQLYSSGRILIVGKRGEEVPFRTRGGQIYDTMEMHLISANPLLIEQNPDRDLSAEARLLCEQAANRDLWIFPRHASINSNGDIQFLLYWKGNEMNHFRTSNMGILEVTAKGKYQAEIVDGINDEQTIFPDLLPADLVLGMCHSGGATTYMQYLMPDTEKMNSWRYILRYRLHLLKLSLIKVSAKICLWMRHLFGGSLLRFYLKTLLFLYGEQLLPVCPQPAYIFVLSYDARRRAYQRIKKASMNVEINLFDVQNLPTVEASSKEFFQVTYPCFCNDEIRSDYVVKSFGDPSVPPSLLRACQSSLSTSFPSLRLFTRNIRRQLGLCDALSFNNYRYMT